MLRGVRNVVMATALAVPLLVAGLAGGSAGAIPAGVTVCFGVDATPGDAAIVNLTPVLATAAGDGQLVPFDLGGQPPEAANVNFAPGAVDPNVAFARVGPAGSLCFINSQHAEVEVVADHLGTIDGTWYRFATKNGAPKRVIDTRANTIIRPNRSRCFRVAGKPGDAAVVNLTPVAATADGDGQLVSSNVRNKPPKAANVNFGPGTVDPNVAIAEIGTDNRVCFINSKHASVHVVGDHMGTIKADAYQAARRDGAPKRVLDTRTGKKIPPRGNRCFKVAGNPGDAAIVNLSPVKANRAGNGQLVSSDVKDKPPKAANVNFAKGATDPNVAIAVIGDDNQVCFINSKHSAVHLVADHLGTIKSRAYNPARANGAPRRAIDTRTQAEVTPVGAKGPRTVRPSEVTFECAITPGATTLYGRRISIRGLDPTIPTKIKLWVYSDPLVPGGYEVSLTLPTGRTSYTFLQELSSPEPVSDAEVWDTRVRVDTYGDIPALKSTTVFSISAPCREGKRLQQEAAQDVPAQISPLDESGNSKQ